jgi:hypothetical protein
MHPSPRKLDMLDVRLLDLFAQVEALLRLARDVQRHIIPLRGTSGPLPAAERRRRVAALRRSLRLIAEEADVFPAVIRRISEAADDLFPERSTANPAAQRRLRHRRDTRLRPRR